jgi:hypothetical protein
VTPYCKANANAAVRVCSRIVVIRKYVKTSLLPNGMLHGNQLVRLAEKPWKEGKRGGVSATGRQATSWKPGDEPFSIITEGQAFKSALERTCSSQ